MSARLGMAMGIAIAAAVLTALVAVSACGEAKAGKGSPAGQGQSAGAHPEAQLPTDAPLAVAGRTLSQLDPLTLEPQGPSLRLGEYHDTWSYSPNGSRIALGMGSPSVPVCGAGVCVVDTETMRVKQDIAAPIAAEKVGWVSRRRVVAILQSGEVIVVDPITGETIREDNLGVPVLTSPTSHDTPEGFAVLVGDDPLKLVAFDDDGELSLVSLDQISLGDGSVGPERAALAVDPEQNRALVFAAGFPAAEIDLETMDVGYHSIDLPWDDGEPGDEHASFRSASWLGGGLVAVSGTDYVRQPGSEIEQRPAGISVVDTAAWTWEQVDEEATRITLAADRLLAWRELFERGQGIGLRIYSAAGQELVAHRLGSKKLNVQLHGEHVYAISSKRLRVVRAKNGKVVATSPWRRGPSLTVLTP